jgi:hypothetical protein
VSEDSEYAITTILGGELPDNVWQTTTNYLPFAITLQQHGIFYLLLHVISLQENPSDTLDISP